jgi:hypothetical protein
MTMPDLADKLRAHVTRFDVQLSLCVQLAIEEVLADQEFGRRVDLDPGFGQLAHDALYALSRRWEADAPEYDAGEDALETYLNTRLKEQRETAAGGLAVKRQDVTLLAARTGGSSTI